MKQEFEMTQSEMDDIIAINKSRSPVMKFGDYWSGMDLQERINHYWETLGKKYGFKHLTVEGSPKGKLFFLAEPAPIEITETKTEVESAVSEKEEEAVRFAEWCSVMDYYYDRSKEMWQPNNSDDLSMTTSEMYKIFKNQEEKRGKPLF